jgi:hypothetical protein
MTSDKGRNSALGGQGGAWRTNGSSMTAALHHWLEGAPTARIEDLESRPIVGLRRQTAPISRPEPLETRTTTEPARHVGGTCDAKELSSSKRPGKCPFDSQDYLNTCFG